VAFHYRLPGFAHSSTHKLPARLLQGNRLPDQRFSAGDHLYHRCNREDIIGDRLNGNRIKYGQVSVNWSRYSKPWDVVFDYEGWGIARFVVRELPFRLPKEVVQPKNPKTAPPKLYSFVPEHVPEARNYSHSEILIMKDGIRQFEDVDLPKTVKKEFRQIMADRSLVLHQPTV
jgi:hypothetical protein